MSLVLGCLCFAVVVTVGGLQGRQLCYYWGREEVGNAFFICSTEDKFTLVISWVFVHAFGARYWCVAAWPRSLLICSCSMCKQSI